MTPTNRAMVAHLATVSRGQEVHLVCIAPHVLRLLFSVGNDGCVLIKGCPVPEHRGFEVTLFANPYGSSDNDNDFPIRMVLSSYYIPQLLNQVSESLRDARRPPLLSTHSPHCFQGYGVPDGLSDCSLCQGPGCGQCTGSMAYAKAFDPAAPSYVGPVYTRVHRDGAIVGECHAGIECVSEWLHVCPRVPCVLSAAMRAWMHLPPLNTTEPEAA